MKILLKHNPTTNQLIFIYLIFILPLFFTSTVSLAALGPQLIKDINPDGRSDIYSLSAGNGRLFFSAKDETNIRQIWTSDGTAAGTVQMTDIDSSIYGIQLSYKIYLAVNNIYYFHLRRWSDNEYELWRSDGTVAGTFKLIDLPDVIDSGIRTVGAGGLYYFVPWSDKVYGRELWVSDGSVSGTRMVKDINPGTYSSSPHNLIKVNNKLYFLSANDLWTSDGTSAGTKLVANFEEGRYDDMRSISNVNGIIYLSYLNNSGYELWRHDSNSGQTVIVKNFSGLRSESTAYAAVGDILYFVAKGINSDAFDLWKSDGSPGGTVMVRNIGETNASYTDWHLTNVDGTLFFKANDGTHGWELWKSDGTASGTFMLKDINDTSYSSKLNCFTAVGDTLFFIYEKTSYVKTLWMSDGTEAGTIETNMGVDNLKCPVNFNGQLYFYGADRTTKDYSTELYRYNLSSNIPAAPEVKVSANGTRVNISWHVMPNSDGYTLSYAPYPFTGPETIASVELGNVSSLSAELWSGAAFYIVVQSSNSGALSGYSNVELFIIK
ncbi:MAG: hypothetical protein KAI17_14395 [Thiotrichaceae bacterium]|nr:hypothetical protein [Thiotrichaceae bacterium]